MRNPEQTIGHILDKQSSVILVCVDEEGFPNAKAMYTPRKREGIRVFYLSTNTSSTKVKQFLANPKACMQFMDKRFFRQVMLKGTVEIINDIDIKQSIWNEKDLMYYPLGIQDPDYSVLRFTACSGRYYSNFKSEDFMIE